MFASFNSKLSVSRNLKLSQFKPTANEVIEKKLIEQTTKLRDKISKSLDFQSRTLATF